MSIKSMPDNVLKIIMNEQNEIYCKLAICCKKFRNIALTHLSDYMNHYNHIIIDRLIRSIFKKDESIIKYYSENDKKLHLDYTIKQMHKYLDKNIIELNSFINFIIQEKTSIMIYDDKNIEYTFLNNDDSFYLQSMNEYLITRNVCYFAHLWRELNINLFLINKNRDDKIIDSIINHFSNSDHNDIYWSSIELLILSYLDEFVYMVYSIIKNNENYSQYNCHSDWELSDDEFSIDDLDF